MGVGQNQGSHFREGAPPILVYFGGDWDVHWGHGILTHDHISTGPHVPMQIISSARSGELDVWSSYTLHLFAFSPHKQKDGSHRFPKPTWGDIPSRRRFHGIYM